MRHILKILWIKFNTARCMAMLILLDHVLRLVRRALDWAERKGGVDVKKLC